MELVSDVTILGTELGQAVQAMSVISRLSPAGQLMHLKRVVKKLSEEIERKTPKKKRQKNSNTQNTQGTINEFAEIVSSDENKMPKEIRDNSKLKNIVDKITDGEQAKMELPQEIADNEEFKTAMNEIVTGKTNDNSKLKSIVEKLSDEIVTGEQTKTDLPKETRDNSKLENISNEIVNGSQEEVDLPKNDYDNSKLMELVDKVVEGEQSKIELKQEMKDNTKLEKIVTEVVEGEQGKLDLGTSDEALDSIGEFKGLEITPEMETEILSAQTPKELEMAMTRVKEQLASQMPVGWTEKLSSWRYLSMLGNPKTHIRNIFGNLIMTTTLYQGKNFIQRAVETVFDSKLEERTRTFKKSTDEVKYFAEKMLEENVETLTGSGYANIQSEIKDMRKIFKIGLLNKISELNSNALSKEDFWFKAPIFKSALAEYLTANGIKTEQDIKQNKEVVQKGISFAIDEALKATFNQYNKLASAISQLENNSALGRVFVGGLAPFKKTPLNIVKTSWQYSPLGLLETATLQTHNLRNGLINANEYIERISQGLTGSAVTLVGMWLASMGLLTGSSGSGKEDEYKESLGMFAPYSIHLPEGEIFGIHLDEKFVDISWLAPSAVPLLVGAEIYDAIINNKEKDVFKTADDIIKILEKTMNPISNMTMLSTFNDALINYGGNDDTSGLEAILSTVIKSYIGQFFPTLGYQINKIIDPTIRSTKASKNSSFKKGEQIVRQNANKIPFTSLLLEPSTDIWGNVRKRSDNFVVRAVDSLFNPASVEKPSATGVDEKILKLYGVNKNNEILPSIPRDSFTVNSETYEMSASEYTQYKMTYGQTAYKKLKTLFSTSEYRQMSNEEKEKAIAEVYEMSKKLAQYEYMTAKYGKTKAMSRLLNDKELKKYNEANKLGLNYEKYLEAYYSQKSVEGEKDKKGKTIKNSKKENQIEAIQKALNTTEEKAKKLQAIFEGK